MASVEEFASLLKDTVAGKRLSASKMNALTDLAMKNLAHDNQLVSVLYRTHRSLEPASKISSLYIFDALARAAKSYVVKHNVTGDVFTQPGNAATFLLKIGGVVEGVFQDMMSVDSQEAKEKTKRVLDIWTKGQTFPPETLLSIKHIVEGSSQEPDSKATVTTDPRLQVAAPPPAAVNGPHDSQYSGLLSLPIAFSPVHAPATLPAPPALDPQATLLALLSQVAAVTPSFSTPALAPAPGPLDATQLAVLQQLAHTAASVPTVTQSLPPSTAVNVHNFPSSSAISSSRSPPHHHDGPHSGFKHDERHKPRYRSPENEYGYSGYPDERDYTNGRSRGGFRARGRGERFGRRWDDRNRFRDERDRSPRRGGRSRSRSPSNTRNNGDPRRNFRPNSPPPRKPPIQSPAARSEPPGATRDEFGRDIRSGSPAKSPPTQRSATPPSQPLPQPPPQSREPQPMQSIQTFQSPDHDAPSTNGSTNSGSSGGMETFDPATFDFTSPASWEALGKKWQVTHAYVPSTEELMAFVMMGGQTNGMAPMMHSHMNDSPMRGGRGGRGKGGSFGARNGHMNRGGSGYEDQEYYGSQDMQGSDAIVLGEEPYNAAQAPVDQRQRQALSPPQSSSSPYGGKMQKVDGKWVFVKGATVVDSS